MSIKSQTISLGKVTSHVVGGFYILPEHMKRKETLGEYVRRWMMSHTPNLTAKDVEARARLREHDISDSTINNVLGDVGSDMRMSIIKGLSAGLGRPIEEVAAVAFGYQLTDDEFGKSAFANLWRLYQDLPTEEDQKYFSRQIDAMAKEMQALITKPKRRKS